MISGTTQKVPVAYLIILSHDVCCPPGTLMTLMTVMMTDEFQKSSLNFNVDVNADVCLTPCGGLPVE